MSRLIRIVRFKIAHELRDPTKFEIPNKKHINMFPYVSICFHSFPLGKSMKSLAMPSHATISILSWPSTRTKHSARGSISEILSASWEPGIVTKGCTGRCARLKMERTWEFSGIFHGSWGKNIGKMVMKEYERV